VTAIMASYFGLANTVSGWMVREGLPPASADAYVSALLLGLAGEAPLHGFATLAEAHQTKGGLNEQVLKHVTEKGALKEIAIALDQVLRRLRNTP
jgi:pyrroline-5-carboxylate reductase